MIAPTLGYLFSRSMVTWADAVVASSASAITPANTVGMCSPGFVGFIPLVAGAALRVATMGSRLCLFTHGEVERFTQERHDRAQFLCGPDKDDV